MKSIIITIISLATVLNTFCQDSVTYYIEGIVRDLPREFPIDKALITITGPNQMYLETKSDSTGRYSIRFRGTTNRKDYILEAYADEHYSTGSKLHSYEDSLFHYNVNFDLHPFMTSACEYFPDKYKFELNSSKLHPDDSLGIVLVFTTAYFKEDFKKKLYNIITRKSSDESEDICLKRGNSIRNLLIQVGVAPENVTIESKSTQDFFYCKHCNGNVYLFQLGQGINITQELIDQTLDPVKKEEYESMRRIAQIEIKKSN